MTPTANLAPGTIVQYRKVGTFAVVEGPIDGYGDDHRGAGWYWCDPIKAPKKYRDEGRMRLWVGPSNVVAA